MKINKNNYTTSFNNKCSYFLIQDNIIVVPILNEDILNIDNNKINDNNHNISNKSEKDNNENVKKQKIKKEKKIKIIKKIKNKQYFYIHICKKNLIHFLLLNEYSIINYILTFLSGIYSGYFEELNKNNSIILKVDKFQLFLYYNHSIDNNEYSNIQVLGKGNDEYGEYLIKGNMELVHNLEKYQKENDNISKKNKERVIFFGNINGFLSQTI